MDIAIISNRLRDRMIRTLEDDGDYDIIKLIKGHKLEVKHKSTGDVYWIDFVVQPRKVRVLSDPLEKLRK